jgi:hypothetical protein
VGAMTASRAPADFLLTLAPWKIKRPGQLVHIRTSDLAFLGVGDTGIEPVTSTVSR